MKLSVKRQVALTGTVPIKNNKMKGKFVTTLRRGETNFYDFFLLKVNM